MPSAAARRAASVLPPRIVGDLGVRQAGQVVVGHGLTSAWSGSSASASLGRRRAVRFAILGGAAPVPGFGDRDRRRASARVMSMALRCAIVTSHASTLAPAGKSG